jgi:hypothetical protein
MGIATVSILQNYAFLPSSILWLAGLNFAGLTLYINHEDPGNEGHRLRDRSNLPGLQEKNHPQLSVTSGESMRTDVQTQAAPAPVSTQSSELESSLVALAIVLPLIVVATVLGYRRYRLVKLRQQIESLERIWKMTYRQTRS